MNGQRLARVAGGVVAVGLTAWFVWTVDWVDVQRAFREVEAGALLVAVGWMSGEWVLRGLRWGILFQAIDPKVPLWAFVRATIIGGAANTLVPFRGGDLLRPAIVSAERGIPFVTVLSSTLVERVLDGVGILGLLLALVATAPIHAQQNDLLANLREVVVSIVLVGGFIGVFGSVVGSGRFRPELSRWLLRYRFGGSVLRRMDEVGAGLRAAGSPWRLGVALAMTGGIWFCGVASIMAVIEAFGMNLPIAAAISVQVALIAAMSIPQAPGFWGVFQVVMERSLAAWHAPAGASQAAALAFWAVSFIPVTALGLFLAWRQGISLTSAPAEAVKRLPSIPGTSE